MASLPSHIAFDKLHRRMLQDNGRFQLTTLGIRMHPSYLNVSSADLKGEEVVRTTPSLWEYIHQPLPIIKYPLKTLISLLLGILGVSLQSIRKYMWAGIN